MWHKPPVYGPLRGHVQILTSSAFSPHRDATVCGCDLIFTAFLLLKTYWLRWDPIDLDSAHSFKRPPLDALIIIHQHCSYVLKRLPFNGSFFHLWLRFFFFFFRFTFNLSNLSWFLYSNCSRLIIYALGYLRHPGKTLLPFKNPQPLALG